MITGIDKSRALMRQSELKPVVRTDHKPLLALSHCRSPMVARWFHEFVMSERFSIVYRKGIHQINADYLSRDAVTALGPGKPDVEGVSTLVRTLHEQGVLPDLSGTRKRYYVPKGTA